MTFLIQENGDVTKLEESHLAMLVPFLEMVLDLAKPVVGTSTADSVLFVYLLVYTKGRCAFKRRVNLAPQSHSLGKITCTI